ncbi:MAG TPA: hypothetical protein VHM48_01830 [Candidatus Limnocylindrales bacterium]|nr:hypothetical protein [Candidatus Limnocylindrales bacterium]
MLTQPARPGSGRAIAWAAATVVGLAAGGFAFHFPGSVGARRDPSALVFGTLLGGVSGLVAGLLQAIALRGAVARGRWRTSSRVSSPARSSRRS